MNEDVTFVSGLELLRVRRKERACAAIDWERYADSRFGIAQWSVGRPGEEREPRLDGSRRPEQWWVSLQLGQVTLREAVRGAARIEGLLDEEAELAKKVKAPVKPLRVEKVSAAQLGKKRMDLVWAQENTDGEVETKSDDRGGMFFGLLPSLPRVPVVAPPNTAVTGAELGRYHRELLFPDKMRKRMESVMGVLSTTEVEEALRERRRQFYLKLTVLAAVCVVLLALFLLLRWFLLR
mmetsp:Transcript_38800/g.153249  ORF Transcript_38800/g.153249 Transcript_38800/m.153249 type:complete len:237 (-) Transcript_38800:4760-5470(-)